MGLLLTYLGLALAGNIGIYFAGLLVERVWPAASLPLYLLMFFAVMGFAWILAVKITEPRVAAAEAAKN